MDVETSTKGSGCLKHHKSLIFDGKQHPKKKLVPWMLKSPLTSVLNEFDLFFCLND
jgi:hypothetical protein